MPWYSCKPDTIQATPAAIAKNICDQIHKNLEKSRKVKYSV